MEPMPDDGRTRDRRPTGRASVRRHIGRAAVSRVVAAAPVPRALLTHVLRRGDEQTSPVFVDSSGRRKRRLRRFAYAICAAAVLLVIVLWLSQAGGPVRPKPLDPCATSQAGPAGGGSPTAPAGAAASDGKASPPDCVPAPASTTRRTS